MNGIFYFFQKFFDFGYIFALLDGKGIHISKNVKGEKVKVDLNWNQVEKRISELIKMDRYLNPKEKEIYPQWLEKEEIRRAEVAEERRKREILSTAPPEKKEPEQTNDAYEYHLGNTVYIGANEYEIQSFDDDRVMLYDLQFPLFNKEMTRTEFDQKVRENPMNDHLKAKNTEVEQGTATPDIPFTNGETHYFYRPDSKRWDAVYYNPDATAGGQFVVTHLSLDEIIGAKENSSSVESFLSTAKCTLTELAIMKAQWKPLYHRLRASLNEYPFMTVKSAS